MRKFIILLLILIGFASIGQTGQYQTIWDTTRTDGQRFIITAPLEVRVYLTDSITWINDSTAVEAGNYFSLVNSYAKFDVQRIRIISGDTLVRIEQVTVPLYKIDNNAVQFLTGAATKKQIKKKTKPWISRELQQE